MALPDKLKEDQKNKINEIHAFLRNHNIPSKKAADYFGYEYKSFQAMLHGKKFSYKRTLEMYEKLQDLQRFTKKI